MNLLGQERKLLMKGGVLPKRKEVTLKVVRGGRDLASIHNEGSWGGGSKGGKIEG